MKNLNPVWTAYTKAYQTQEAIQSHFLDDSNDTMRPGLVWKKLKWVKKICHFVNSKTIQKKSDQSTVNINTFQDEDLNINTLLTMGLG
jgi:DNA uptake protein ComE-like DNA-binding protein